MKGEIITLETAKKLYEYENLKSDLKILNEKYNSSLKRIIQCINYAKVKRNQTKVENDSEIILKDVIDILNGKYL